MTKVLRAGVVGAGVFGGYHANKYASLPGVVLAGILDADAARGVALADKLGTRAFTDAEAFFEGMDVVTIASPASSHAGLAAAALERGLHVYVEKPLALTVADGQGLVDLARARNRVLACGHQERAIFAAIGLTRVGEKPMRLEAVRRSSYSERGTDVSCVLDMMIHDLDLALALNGSSPAQVRAAGRAEPGPHLDEVRTQVLFVDDMVLDVDCSRLDEGRIRTMRLVYPSGVVALDFMARTFDNGAGLDLNPGFADTPDGRDPLGASVSAFLAAARGEAERPLVTGEEALRALELGLRVEAAAG